MTNQPIAVIKEAGKEYKTGDQTITALQATNLTLHTGELTLIIGPSGSGKTTLLSLLGCVIYPSYGEVWIDGRNITQLKANDLAKVRLNTIGFVFQNFNLLAPLSAEDNVGIPLLLQNVEKAVIKQKVEKALALVGMKDRRKNLAKQLSGGQQQRVAIARALVTDPKLILCDEPTASLDKGSLDVIMDELKNLADNGKCIVVVTHDPRLKKYAHRVIEVENGYARETSPDDPHNSLH